MYLYQGTPLTTLFRRMPEEVKSLPDLVFDLKVPLVGWLWSMTT
ncbi:hypothetical protein M23134_07107 [Microscilla marina ATCC 23134]|uniref:Uncharacterized protein n=1 Tax=Microscilla marina ATCC 23134 TaxID=313606 RepID=A1ZUD8_MICM2|nr:hypothetical protein M23134_07107 [Microscilla marina ATCC 23134]